MISLGLDLSLVETGCVLLEDGKILDKWLVKSKPSGKDPVNELKRLMNIVSEISNRLMKQNNLNKFIARPYGIVNWKEIDIVIIEGLAYMARNTTSLLQLSGLNYMIREHFYNINIPFVIVAPTTLKKFITEKGNSPKEFMLLETYKRYKVSFDNNNLCDAYGLAKIGEALLNKKIKLTKKQEEAINKLKEQTYEKTK